MKSLLTKPRLEHLIFFILILPFLGGVTSEEVILDLFEGPEQVNDGTRINFTGVARPSTPGSYPQGLRYSIRKKNTRFLAHICNVDFSICSPSINEPCYCSRKNGDTFYFVIKVIATLDRSEAELIGSIGNPQKYPKVIIPTTTISTTATAGPTNGSDGRGISETHTIAVGILSVRVLALLK